MKILLTNDDGFHAEGLWELYNALAAFHRLWVVAPDRERSAVGHGITLHQPLRATLSRGNANKKGWAVSGTPADCVKLAINELLPQQPDMIISGINPGANVGVDLNYSGTVAAAKEAALYGVPAVAVSIQNGGPPAHYSSAAGFIANLIPIIYVKKLPPGTFLNVNVPNIPEHQIAGARLTRQGIDQYGESFEKRRDPRNRFYYWQSAKTQPLYHHPDVDGALLEANYISITPVRCDMTDFDSLGELKTWGLEKDEDGAHFN
ncbi:MAG: 5'/3'-nucleotidase SurE [Desulfobacteraceae bacterium]|nr:5'/3'-nucleotidase SurE [Desulfobacteraceae bacterium]